MVRKEKISVTLDPTVVGELSERVGEQYESRSEAVEDLLTTAFAADEREHEYEERIDDLEREVERLNRERRQLLEQRDEHQELALYAKEQRDEARTDKRRRQHNIVRRAWWAVAGEPADL